MATIVNILDRLAPITQVTHRTRRSDPWCDDDCRSRKRETRENRYRTSRAPSDRASWTSGVRKMHKYFATKSHSSWMNKIESFKCDSRRLWATVKHQMGKKPTSAQHEYSADEFMSFFTKKVVDIRQDTEGSPPPTFTHGLGCQFMKFDALICDDVTQLTRRIPPKQSALDPRPTWLLKECTDDISPFLTKIIDLSMSSSSVPLNLKEAYITPLLKKPTLDKSDINNYRPISNLSVLSKLLERAICTQLVSCLNVNSFMPRHQSAYHRRHLTETALALVFSELISALDDGNLALMALLNLSAAFDCVDHDILLSRLNITYGIRNTVHSWMSSYLSGRTQFVRVDGA